MPASRTTQLALGFIEESSMEDEERAQASDPARSAPVLRAPQGKRAATPDRRAPVFADNMKLPVHRWFRYSAGFSALWARSTIEHAAQERGEAPRVLDPFAGSGTTMLAAQEANAGSIGVEPHPFVHRVASAKLGWQSDPDQLRRAAEQIVARCRRRVVASAPESEVPQLLVKCYEPVVLQQLKALHREALSGTGSSSLDELLWLGVMAILRPTSHVGTAQWQYVLPNKRKVRVADPFDAFLQTCLMFSEDIETRRAALSAEGPAQAEVIRADARNLSSLSDGSVDLVVTSPPYANNYDYADAARLEMTFEGSVSSWGDLSRIRSELMRSCTQHMAGFDIEAALQDTRLGPIQSELTPVVRELTTTKAERAGKKAYDAMITAYFLDMAEVWRQLRRVCAPDASLYFVIGDSAPYGVHAPVDRWLGELALGAGFRTFEFAKLRTRNDKWKNRKHRVPLHEGVLKVEG